MTRAELRRAARNGHKVSPKVCLAYIHPDVVNARWMNALRALEWHDRMHHRYITHYITMQSGPRIASARNTVVRQFLKLDAEWLFMTDTDMLPAQDALDQMMAVVDPLKVPMLGALCFAGGRAAEIYPTIYKVGLDGDGVLCTARIDDYPRDALVEVDGTGAAFLVIHRSVLETVGERMTGTAYPWFAETEHGGREFGEDLTFCIRVRNAGFPIHVDTRIKVGHAKAFVVDETEFDIQQARLGVMSAADLQAEQNARFGLAGVEVST